MSKPPAALELSIEMLKTGFLEVVIAICFMPFMFMSQHEDGFDVAFENGIEGVMLRQKLYRNPDFIAFITKLLPKFLHKGFLN
jgi:hypothetical protein